MASRKLYFDAIHVGDELPALAKAPVERVQLVRYAGASGDFNPVHVDEVYARGLGMPSVYAPGMLVMGFLAQLVSDWARGAQLRRYSVRFIKMVWPGDTVVCKGRITDRYGDNGRYFAEIELWAENQRGELVMKGQSQIQLFYSLEDENRQRAGQPPLLVQVPRQSLLGAAPPGQAATSKAGSMISKKTSAHSAHAQSKSKGKRPAAHKKPTAHKKPPAKHAKVKKKGKKGR